MKFLGLILLVAFLVSALGQTEEQFEESDHQSQHALTEVDSKVGDWFKEVWAKIVKFFQELGPKMKAFFENLFPKELREKIVATFKKLGDIIKSKVEDTFLKYKDLIIKALTEDYKVIAVQAAKLFTAAVEGIAKAITDLIKKIIGTKFSENELMGGGDKIKEMWAKFKKIVVTFFKEKADEFVAMWKRIKPAFENLLKRLEKDFISEGKGLLIDLLGDMIKIIIGWGDNDELSDVNNKIDEWFKQAWLKVKKFFDDLGVKIKKFFDELGVKIKLDWAKVEEAFKDLGKKIKEAFNKVFPPDVQAKLIATLKKTFEDIKAKVEGEFLKYKDAIIAAFTADGKVIVAEAKKLLTHMVEGLTKLVVDLIKKIIGEKYMLDEDLEDSIQELWEKFKMAVVKYALKQAALWKKFAAKYKPILITELNKFKKELIEGGRQLVIDMLQDIIKIIITPPQIENKCIDNKPEYCHSRFEFCKAPGFVDYMRHVCAKTCGYCK